MGQWKHRPGGGVLLRLSPVLIFAGWGGSLGCLNRGVRGPNRDGRRREREREQWSVLIDCRHRHFEPLVQYVVCIPSSASYEQRLTNIMSAAHRQRGRSHRLLHWLQPSWPPQLQGLGKMGKWGEMGKRGGGNGEKWGIVRTCQQYILGNG